MLIREFGKEQFAVSVRCSASYLDKLMSETHKSIPRLPMRKAMAEAAGISENDLFPVVESEIDATG